MSWLNTHMVAANTASQYAMSEDFRKLFTEDAHSLYLLSFLLTANREKAERCFVAAFGEHVEEDSVSLEWARSFSRRVIVCNAIQMVAPHPYGTEPARGASHLAGEGDLSTMPLQGARFTGILALKDFERFVYVLSVLEGFPDHDCAALLSTSMDEVQETRLRAVQKISAEHQLCKCGGLIDNDGDV